MNIVKFVTAVAASVILSGTAQAELISASADRQLCQAASRDGSLELAVEAMMDAGQFRYDMAPALLNMRCGQISLIQGLINDSRAENLEYAVIDLGVDVNSPLVPVEAGQLSVVQYLMQQAVMAPSVEAREFAMEYMHDFRSVDFNPNLQLVTLK